MNIIYYACNQRQDLLGIREDGFLADLLQKSMYISFFYPIYCLMDWQTTSAGKNFIIFYDKIDHILKISQFFVSGCGN